MPCYHPNDAWQVLNPLPGSKSIFFKHPPSFRVGLKVKFLNLPCGQCIGCKLERSRQWAIRCHHEASYHDQNSFVTLTYNNDHLPPNHSVDVRVLQLFLKRLRKKLATPEKPDPFRFFACGEYGDKFKRPHYHILIFGWDDPNKEKHGTPAPGRSQLYTSPLIKKIWTDPETKASRGFNTTGAVTFESAAYVARYCLKKITGPEADKHYETSIPGQKGIHKLKPEFTNMSRGQGIGKQWLLDNMREVYDHDEVIIKNRRSKPPIYYDKLFKKLHPEEFLEIRKTRETNAQKYSEDQTPERLAVREFVAHKKVSNRDFETEESQ